MLHQPGWDAQLRCSQGALAVSRRNPPCPAPPCPALHAAPPCAGGRPEPSPGVRARPGGSAVGDEQVGGRRQRTRPAHRVAAGGRTCAAHALI